MLSVSVTSSFVPNSSSYNIAIVIISTYKNNCLILKQLIVSDLVNNTCDIANSERGGFSSSVAIMDFALLNVNDKSLSKSTPNLNARRASDVGQAAAAVAAESQEKAASRRKFSEARLKPAPWRKLFGGGDGHRKRSPGSAAAAAGAGDGDVSIECIVSPSVRPPVSSHYRVRGCAYPLGRARRRKLSPWTKFPFSRKFEPSERER